MEKVLETRRRKSFERKIEKLGDKVEEKQKIDQQFLH